MKKALFCVLPALLLSVILTGCDAENTSVHYGGGAFGATSEALSADTGTSPGQQSHGSGAGASGPQTGSTPSTEEAMEESEKMRINVSVGGATFTATLEENAATESLLEMLREAPLTITIRDYGGFEKVGALGTSLPASNSQTTTQAGDIVLYQGNQIVIFYGSNSWSYTRLGRVDDLGGWEEALGGGDVTVTFSLGG